ncbi:MAG: hypothetical protein WB239_05905 [Acidimicrobiia bacterium]
MRSRVSFVVLGLLLTTGLIGACSASTSATSAVPSSSIAATTATISSSAVSTTEPPPPCPPAPYELGSLPTEVVPATGDTPAEPDEFTSIGGTNTTLWVGHGGDPAIALIRGALPPHRFPGEKGEVDVAGTRAVAGPYPDGRWVVAWYNAPGARCDLYTMVFYPPVSPDEVQQTLAAMSRLAG